VAGHQFEHDDNPSNGEGKKGKPRKVDSGKKIVRFAVPTPLTNALIATEHRTLSGQRGKPGCNDYWELPYGYGITQVALISE
jgi:hypothetical protein